MNKARHFWIFITFLSICSAAHGNNFYIVKAGDTLSDIVEQQTSPPPPLYGVNGRLEQILKLNPAIRDRSLIVPGQRILLRCLTSVEPTIKEVTEDISAERVPPITDDAGVFEFGLGLGGRFSSISQSGGFGSGDTGKLSIADLELISLYRKEDYEFLLELGSHEHSSSAGSKRLYRYQLKAAYKSFFGGVLFEQRPLFLIGSGTTELITETATQLFLGHRWHRVMSKTVPTYLTLEASGTLLIGSGTDDSDVKVDSSSGYGADLLVGLERKLNYKNNLYYYWNNGISYRSYSRKLEYQNASGDIDSDYVVVKSTVGIKAKF